ncbi:hypothetical protein [uncultured Methylobacterium sp.]|jgi:hypothetical protein|uniref:hypothetical protein n=1 Tax=uncultured Methylobacterium sp. TaxID=157278 RepID=UPI00261563A2|nr:hypothetical protein [uncultured Methylobacterium sp.]
MDPIIHLRLIRESVEDDVVFEVVDANIGRGVYGYVGALVRLVEDGDRDPKTALAEARAAVDFLAATPRLPDARLREWRPQ